MFANCWGCKLKRHLDHNRWKLEMTWILVQLIYIAPVAAKTHVFCTIFSSIEVVSKWARVAQRWERSPLTTVVPSNSRTWHHMWVEFVGSLPCFEGFLQVLWFSSLHKNQPWFNLGCAPWPDMSIMVAARGTLVCLRLSHVELRPCNSATRLKVGWLANPIC